MKSIKLIVDKYNGNLNINVNNNIFQISIVFLFTNDKKV